MCWFRNTALTISWYFVTLEPYNEVTLVLGAGGEVRRFDRLKATEPADGADLNLYDDWN